MPGRRVPARARDTLQPAFCERRETGDRVACELRQHHAITDRHRPVPGAVLRDENLVPILRRKHGPGIEPHPDGGTVRIELACRRLKLAAGMLVAELGILDFSRVTIRETKDEPL